ncbi:N-glycosylase/DNA lyase [Cladobotryum mycophilum]|uniref:DNA-(apurinic or apyrimidinic site) lyase n=1 Tax=Cladobotryum mycophilum TaxID=491253 RepID=A0ABR0SFE8_9HYPO
MADWRRLPVSLAELCIDTTLRCGQSFRWRKLNDEWTCTLHGRILSLKQDSTHLHYKVIWPERSTIPPATSVQDKPQEDDTEELLRHYFSLHLDLGALYKQWSKADANFRKKAPGFTGVRILNQDAWEALICFICSSNNNISRISQMAHKLCTHYGPLIGRVGEEALHDFPTPDALTGKQVESHLRELGFGYRAKYIAETARIIAEDKPALWLESLRNPEAPSFKSPKLPDGSQSTYKEAHAALLSLTGVGPKVADCVCLMGLGWGESVPVDTHVWQIAQRDYKFGKTKAKTFNKAMYDAVGDHFRSIWGNYAGWAHSVLFTADLKEFSDRVKQEKDEARLEGSNQETQGKRTARKRKAVVEAEEKIEIKEEDAKEVVILEVERTVKRRRTRANP